jgi:hypothetical protein
MLVIVPQAGDQRLAGAVDDLGICGRFHLRGRTDGGDAAVLHDDRLRVAEDCAHRNRRA